MLLFSSLYVFMFVFYQLSYMSFQYKHDFCNCFMLGGVITHGSKLRNKPFKQGFPDTACDVLSRCVPRLHMCTILYMSCARSVRRRGTKWENATGDAHLEP